MEAPARLRTRYRNESAASRFPWVRMNPARINNAPTIWTIWSALTRTFSPGGRYRADPITRRSPRRLVITGSPTGDGPPPTRRVKPHRPDSGLNSGAAAIESPKLRRCEGHQNQNRACHLDEEVGHSDRPLDTGLRILSMLGGLMSGMSSARFRACRAYRAREGVVRQGQADADGGPTVGDQELAAHVGGIV